MQAEHAVYLDGEAIQSKFGAYMPEGLAGALPRATVLTAQPREDGVVVRVEVSSTSPFIEAVETQFAEAQLREARVELSSLDAMVQQHMLMHSTSGSPDELEELTGGRAPITRELLADPWGTSYVYRKKGARDYELFSAGPDGQEGTEDDVRRDR